jgi:leucyl aminopeptidase
MHPLLLTESAKAIPIHLVTAADWPAFRDRLPAPQRQFAEAQAFEPKPGQHIILPGSGGRIACVVFGMEPATTRRPDPFLPGKLAVLLPAGDYRFAKAPKQPALATLSWLTSAYRFTRYKAAKEPAARLVVPRGVDGMDIARQARALAHGRDLINTPANDLGPAEIEAAVRALASCHGAAVSSIVGDELLAHRCGMIHAVGMGSVRPPRLVDLTWGDPAHPKVTLVGKGVCFDTGGNDIKPSSAMLLMKKDMGGAATAIAAADMIMSAGLKVRLRLLIPTVENSVSGSAFRPGDVLQSRKGLTVEIGNTDAEGRLILGDALAIADEEAPELIIDYATLTGAARVALGPDLPPLFTHDEALAQDLSQLGEAINDPVWRLPLWPAYEPMLDSKIAQVNHTASSPFAGAITAALFLNRFVETCRSYAHFDIFGWVPATKPGRPEGGECMTARLTYALVRKRYGT